jgi:hypothetical protein
MPSPREDDWSDSDDEALSDVETSVLLGVPDGLVEATDANDAAVSRIGGHPVRFISHMYYHTEYLDLYPRLFSLRVNPLSLRPNAKYVQTRPSSWSKCGAHSRTAPWTVLSTSSVAQGGRVRESKAGEPLVCMLVKPVFHRWYPSACEPGEVSATTKNTPQSLKKNSQKSAKPQKPK